MTRFFVLMLGGLLLAGCATRETTTLVQEHALAIGDMQIIGQAEYVTVLPQEFRYRGRIDSGATTCSMSALEIERFERDGEKWVRFRLPVPKNSSTDKLELSEPVELPITREAHIKRHGAEDQVRPTVKLNVRLGQFEGRVEFTLTDRTKYEFPVLIGRNLLEGQAVIDVSRSYIAENN